MTYADEVLADAPLGYWRMGEASGTTLVDSSGNARDGSYVNGAAPGAPGLLDGDADTAATFDGSNDRATVPYGAWMQGGPFAAFTVEAWVKPSSVSGGTDLILDRTNLGSATDSNYQFYLKRISGETYGLLMRVGGAQRDLISAAAGLAVAGGIAHLVGVYDGTAVRLYVNGVEVDSQAASGTVATGGTLPLNIGSFSSTYAFPGVIDEVAIYGTALSPARIQTHYEVGAGTAAPTVSWLWAGAVTDTSFTVSAKVPAGTSVRLGVEAGATLTTPTYGTAVVADANGYVKVTATGLTADTAYAYGLELDGTLDPTVGHVTTFPAAGTAASFSFAHASCALTGSEHRVFDAITARAPLFFQHMGDLHYEDINTNDAALFRSAYNSVHASSRQGAMYQAIPVNYVWDDHDYGPDNGNKNTTSKPAAQSAYRQVVPHYTLSDAEGIYHWFMAGRVAFIVTDLRSYRDPNSTTDSATKTMLGATQKAWFKQALLDAETAGAALIVWCSTNVYNTDGTTGINYDADTWAAFTYERAELADYIRDNGMAEKVFVIQGDAHMLAYDDGALSDFATSGGAPLRQFCAAALDQTGLVRGDNWSGGTYSGGGQFGYFTFTDDGSTLTWQWDGIQVDPTTGAETVRVTASGTIAPESGASVSQWDGSVRLSGTLVGRWDGTAIQPAASVGRWDGTSVVS